MCGSELLFGAGLIGTVILFLCTTARGYPFLIQYTVTYQEKKLLSSHTRCKQISNGCNMDLVLCTNESLLHNVWYYMCAYSNERLACCFVFAIYLSVLPLSDLIFIPKLIFHALTYTVSTSRCFCMSS